MYQIERRLKTTTWKTRINLKVDGKKRRAFDAEIMAVHTGQHIYLVTYNVEGFCGAFARGGLPGVDFINRLVRAEAQRALDGDIEKWRKAYGAADW
jgi:hypothetical protein